MPVWRCRICRPRADDQRACRRCAGGEEASDSRVAHRHLPRPSWRWTLRSQAARLLGALLCLLLAALNAIASLRARAVAFGLEECGGAAPDAACASSPAKLEVGGVS